MKAYSAGLVFLLLIAQAHAAAAQADGETVWLPLKEQGFFGERTIQLEATVFKPAEAGPHPVVIFNHGSSGGPIPPRHTEKPKAFGAFLVSRGIALIVPMRRGRGQSEGSNGEEPSACTVEAARQGLRSASEAVDATYAYLRQQPWASMDSIVLAGHSRGGLLSTVYAAEHPGAAAGVINFSGGWKDDRCGPVDINTVLFGEAGGRSRVPHLFLYGRGDAFYADASIRNYAAAFSAAGGDAAFTLFDVDRINGHQLFHRAIDTWSGSVDAFLRKLRMSKAETR